MTQSGSAAQNKPNLLARANQRGQPACKTNPIWRPTPNEANRRADHAHINRPYAFSSPGAQALAFYKDAFGASELLRLDSPTGEVVARLSVNGAEFWVADESPEHLNFSPETLGGGTVRMVMIVDDPDAAFERAVSAGAKIVTPMKND